jgi:ABC-type sulfate transport system permease component
VLGLVLGIGMSWSLVRRRITGQVDVDAVDR